MFVIAQLNLLADKGILERKVRMTQCCVTKERIG